MMERTKSNTTLRVTEEGEQEKTTWVRREGGGLQIGLGLLIREGRGKKGGRSAEKQEHGDD